MGAVTTQIRITQVLNERLRKLADKSGFTKEQLISVILGEQLDALDSHDFSNVASPHVFFLRGKLKKSVTPQGEFVDNAEAVIEFIRKLSAKIPQPAGKGGTPNNPQKG